MSIFISVQLRSHTSLTCIILNESCILVFLCSINSRREELPFYVHVHVTFVLLAQRIALSDMTRSEINELLEKLGFYKKSQPEEEVPEEFRFSPAKDSPFKDERVHHKPSTSSLAPENSSSKSNAEVDHTDL